MSANGSIPDGSIASDLTVYGAHAYGYSAGYLADRELEMSTNHTKAATAGPLTMGDPAISITGVSAAVAWDVGTKTYSKITVRGARGNTKARGARGVMVVKDK